MRLHEDGSDPNGWQWAQDEILYDEYGAAYVFAAGTSVTNRNVGERPDQSDLLEYVLSFLTPKQRFVVELSWGVGLERGYSFREISEFMGVYPSSVATTYRRAMKKLRGATVDT